MQQTEPACNAKLQTNQLPENLKGILAAIPHMALAFSGGLDSRFLAYAARLCGCHTVLFHAHGPHVSRQESDFAKSWANEQGFEFYEFYHNPLDLPHVRINGPKRCYDCKTALLQGIKSLMDAKNISGPVCDGSHLDDEKGYRPGREALRKAGVISPLAQAQLTKADIRHYGRLAGISHWDQNAKPCLLTRLAYNLPPNPQTLQAIDACEQEIDAALQKQQIGNYEFRLRLTPAPVLQYSLKLEPALKNSLQIILEKHGFNNSDILEEENVSGFFDRLKSF